MLVVQRDKLRPVRKKFEILLDSNELKWFYMSCAAALPQLDRGSDYESERHRFESYTPHQSNLKPPATGAFLLGRRAWIRTSVEARASRKRGAFLARGRVRRQAGEAGADPRSGCAESYTPHQSNLKPPATGAFLLRRHRMDSNLGRGAGVKRTRSVRSERASPPAGGRSRCGSARQLNG